MRVLYLYCHPLPESFHAALRVEAVAGLAAAGHDVDIIDLYADGFDPVLSIEGRRTYHDEKLNQTGLEDYIRRLRAAEALVVQFPVWAFGPPAMLKGFFDRMLMPGVGFDISNPGRVKPLLGHITRIVGVTTYGRPRLQAIMIGDPPRKIVTRYLRWFAHRRVRVEYHSLYHMNVATIAQREAYMAKVRDAMTRL